MTNVQPSDLKSRCQCFAISIGRQSEIIYAIEAQIWFPTGSDENSDGSHYSMVHIKIGSRLFYAEEVTCIDHAKRQFWVYLSDIVRSVKVIVYIVSETFTMCFVRQFESI